MTPPPASSAQPRRGLLWPSIAALIAFAILVSLGVWQMQRLAWKEALLARIEARIHAAPKPLPSAAEWAKISAGDYEYSRVTATGVFDHDKEVYVFRPAGGVLKEPGYQVLTPLRIENSDTWIIVNRGIVPDRLKQPSRRSEGQIAGETKVTGLLRAPEARTSFTPADNPASKLWFTRDPEAMAKAMGLQNAAPFSIDADATPVPGGWPRGGATVVAIKNDHLSYALTWFALAATLAAMFGLFVWRRGSF